MRRRFIQIDGELVEVTPEYDAGGRKSVVGAILGDKLYSNLPLTNGADISSRTKHREYMKRHGLTTIDDFSSTFKEAEKRRIAEKHGFDPTRKMDIARAIDKVAYKGRR